MTAYKYFDKWNFRLRRPVIIGRRGWIDSLTAQNRYEAFGQLFGLANSAAGDGLAVPEFVITVVPGGGARSHFFTPGGSVRRTIDYKRIDNKLFKWIVIDREYPDQTSRHSLDQTTVRIDARFEPDGSGALTINDLASPTVQMTEFRDVPVAPHWMDVPTFGDWAKLADPDYEAPS